MIAQNADGVTGPDNATRPQPVRPVGDNEKNSLSPSTSFGSYMDKAAQNSSALTPKSSALSPFELTQNQSMLSPGANLDTLLTQVKSANTLLGDMSTQLNTKNLKLKPSQRHVLRTKLADAVDHLQGMNTKMGIDLPESAKTPPNKGGIIGKFLNFINEGQMQLASAQQHILSLKNNKEELNPGTFLSVQLKLAHAQQSIEYASLMLAKVVDDMKMLFNVQI